MAAPTITLTDAVPDDADDVIGGGLDDFNEQQTGYRDARPLAVLVREPETGALIGGLLGRTSYGLLFINIVFLPESLRGSGIGTEMLRRVEEEGRRRGCKSGFLFTITFQAPEFYRNHGWEEFGRIDCDPPGTARVFFRKRFD